MKTLGICLTVLALTTVAAQGALVLYEDFEAYTADTSIHFQGDDAGYYRWFAQINGGALQDHEYANVREVGGNNVLEIINKDVTSIDPELLDTNFTAMGMHSMPITAQGTIYVQWLADGPTDCVMATNDKFPGFGNYAAPDGSVFYQPYGASAWTQNASLLQLNGDEAFIARNGGFTGGYESITPNNPSGQWNELWIQFDVLNDRCKYYRCIDGGAPVQMMSSDGEWWAFRNQDWENNAVKNILFLSGLQPLPGIVAEYSVLIDNIGVDTSGWSLDRYPLPPAPPAEKPGDLDGDGDVDLDDFVILKTSFGTDGGGDCDGDGDTDLDDFVILKTNFGT